MDCILSGLTWNTPTGLQTGSLQIHEGFIQRAGLEIKGNAAIHFKDHYVYPGLINAHDHLEMNLYPKLGNPPYGNYSEWGGDIYKPDRPPVREIERVNIEDRLLWGGVKNMISGVTTVVHHNPWHPILENNHYPVRVLRNVAWSHSLAFSKDIKKDFPGGHGIPFVVHAAEGIDALAFGEIQSLDELGLLKKNTVLVHALGVSDNDLQILRENHCAVIWCPASNLFLFGRTAPVEKMIPGIPVALGSDSTLTGSSSLLEEMQCALQTGLATAEMISGMVTEIPARIFKLEKPVIAPGTPADIMICPILHGNYFENLLRLEPRNISAVFLGGKPVYANEILAKTLSLKHAFTVKDEPKYSVVDVGDLKKRIRKTSGEEVLIKNPLWGSIGT